MKTRAFIIVAAAVVVSVTGAGVVSAAAGEDQAAADAAIAAFSDDVLGLGARSNGPQDTTEAPPEAIAAESPGLTCLGDSGTGLDSSGRIEGETARAFSDDFTLPTADDVPSTDPSYYPGGDNISAGIVTLDEAHQGTLDQLVGSAGSDDVAECIEEAFRALANVELASVDTAGGSVPPSFEVDVTVDPDLGIGDASAQFTLSITTTLEGESYEFTTAVYAARLDRSIAIVNVSSVNSEAGPVVDPLEVLGAVIDSM